MTTLSYHHSVNVDGQIGKWRYPQGVKLFRKAGEFQYILGLIDQSGPVYETLAVSQKEQLQHDLTAFIDDLYDRARQSIVECSAGLECTDDGTNDDIPF